MKKLLLTLILLFSTIQVSLAAEITDTCRTDIDRTNYTAITSTIQEVVLNIGDALHKKIINKDYDYQISYFGKVIELLDNIENNIGLLTPSKKQILGLLKQQVECKVGYINTINNSSLNNENIILNGYFSDNTTGYFGVYSDINLENGKLLVDGTQSTNKTARGESGTNLLSELPVGGSEYKFSADIEPVVGTGQRIVLYSINSSGVYTKLGELSSSGEIQVSIPNDISKLTLWLLVGAGNSALYDNLNLEALNKNTTTDTTTTDTTTTDTTTTDATTTDATTSDEIWQEIDGFKVKKYALDIDTSGAVSVLDYGAKANDSSFDNTQAFQSALDANAKVYIPEGIFYFPTGRNIFIKSNNKLIYGDGTLKSIGTGTRASFTSRYFASLSDLIIDGLTFEDFSVGWDQVTLKNVVTQNCTFEVSKEYAPYMPSSGWGFKSSQKIVAVTVNSVYVYNNRFINMPRASIEILHRDYQGLDISEITYLTDVQIKGNIFTFDSDQYRNPELNCSVSLSDPVNVTVENNYSNGELWGIELGIIGGTNIVKDNFFKNPLPLATGPVTNGSDILLENNHFEGLGLYTYGNQRSFWGGYGDNVTMRNNTFIGSFTFSEMNNFTFENNNVVGGISDSSANTYIMSFDNSKNIKILNNNFEGVRTSPTQAIKAVNGTTGIVSDNTYGGLINSKFVDNQGGSSVSDINNVEK